MSVLRWVLGIAFGVSILAFCLVGPVDRTPLHDQEFYQVSKARLDTMQLLRSPKGKLKSDWTKVSITPGYSMPMAGYKPRPRFESVHDSLYARIIEVSNGYSTAFLINVDLLLFPPLLKERIEIKLKEKGLKPFLYLAATHTHNGVGGWDDSILGYWVLGGYNEQWVEETASKIVDAIAKLNPTPSVMMSWEADASEWVENRIAFDKGAKDGKLRGVTLEREDGKSALLVAFSAHATSIGKESLELSADYPADLIKHIETDFDFGMYMAGMVGSHRIIWFPEGDFEYCAKIADLLYQRIEQRTTVQTVDSLSMVARHVPIAFGPSQMHIEKNWKVRDWVFRSLVNPLEGELTLLELGDLIMIGTPCDFSGEIYVRSELEAFAKARGKQLVITSFNGNYNGYITYDGHYDSLAKDEVRVMNWVGPYFGDYFSEMITALVAK